MRRLEPIDRDDVWYRDLMLHHQLDRVKREVLTQSEAYMEAERKDTTNQFMNSAFVVAASLLVSWGVLAIGAYQVVEGDLNGLFLAMLIMMSLTAFENTTRWPSSQAISRIANKRQSLV